MGEDATMDAGLLVSQATWLRSLARHLVRDPYGAEDVAQETLLAALSAPPEDAGDPKRLRAWLGRVAFNLAHLSRRRNSRRQAREELAAKAERQLPAAEVFVQETVGRLVGEAVEALEEPYRTAIVLRYFEGLSTLEVADRTGTTNSAVRKRLWRARAKLRRDLDGRHNGERHAWFRALVPLAALPEPPGAQLPGSSTLGTPWKLAAALPLLVAAVWTGRSFLDGGEAPRGHASLERAAALEPALATAARRVPVVAPVEAAEGGEPPRADDPPAPPRVRVQVVGVEAQGEPPSRPPTEVRVSGFAVDLLGNPLGGAQVGVAGHEEVLGRTAVDGSFEVSVRDLPITLEARVPGFATVHPARVEPGEEAWPHWLVSTPAVDLAGRVVGAGGSPVAGARLEIVFSDEAFVELPVLVDMTAVTPARVTTDEAGFFELAAVPCGPGTYLRTEHSDHEPDVRPVPSGTRLDLEIRLVPRTERELLAGVVLSETGAPIAGALVTLGSERTESDALGEFLLAVTANERGMLRASKAGYGPARLAAMGQRTGGAFLRMVLASADRTLSGRVEDENDRPLEGWLVFASVPAERGEVAALGLPGSGGAPGPMAVTDAAGRFRLAGLTRDVYAVLGVDPASLLSTEACIAAGGEEGLELHARLADVRERLSGRVATASGLPLAGARVTAELQVVTEQGTWSAHSAAVRADAEGRFALAHVAAGAALRVDHPLCQTVVAAPGGPLRGERELVVAPERHVRLDRAGADGLALLDRDGRPLALRTSAGPAWRAALVGGRSPVLAVDPEAATVIWLRDGDEVGRDPLDLVAEPRSRFR